MFIPYTYKPSYVRVIVATSSSLSVKLTICSLYCNCPLVGSVEGYYIALQRARYSRLRLAISLQQQANRYKLQSKADLLCFSAILRTITKFSNAYILLVACYKIDTSCSKSVSPFQQASVTLLARYSCLDRQA